MASESLRMMGGGKLEGVGSVLFAWVECGSVGVWLVVKNILNIE